MIVANAEAIFTYVDVEEVPELTGQPREIFSLVQTTPSFWRLLNGTELVSVKGSCAIRLWEKTSGNQSHTHFRDKLEGEGVKAIATDHLIRVIAFLLDRRKAHHGTYRIYIGCNDKGEHILLQLSSTTGHPMAHPQLVVQTLNRNMRWLSRTILVVGR